MGEEMGQPNQRLLTAPLKKYMKSWEGTKTYLLLWPQYAYSFSKYTKEVFSVRRG